MTLPYPREIETNELSPRHHGGPARLRVEPRVHDLVRVEGRDLVVAGCVLDVPGTEPAEQLCSAFRRAITKRFLHRRPHADEFTWHKFVRTLQAMMANRRTVGHDTLWQILSLVDGL